MNNPLLQQLHPGVKFILLLVLAFLLTLIGSAVAMGVGSTFGFSMTDVEAMVREPKLEHANALRVMNSITLVFGFLAPALLFYWMFGKKTVNGFLLKSPGMFLLAGPAYIFLAAGWIDMVSRLNEWLIPAGSWMESMAKPSELAAAEMTKVILHTNGTGEFLFTMFAIALVPAVCEEFFFRGAMQPLLAKGFKNVHLAIWCTAALFSAFHMQFYGFLPRLLLGALMGYLVIWSGSLWVSVLAHFANNAFGVWMYVKYGSLETPEEATGEGNIIFTYVLSFALFGFATYVLNKRSKWPWLSFEYLGITQEEEKDPLT